MQVSRAIIWKRRVALMAGVGLLVAVPVTVVVRDGGGDGGPPASQMATPAVPIAGEVQFDRKLGVELRLPEGWKLRKRKQTIRLHSRGRGVIVAIATPGPAEDFKAIYSDAILAIRQQYPRTEIEDQIRRRKLGGLRAVTAVLSAGHPDRRRASVRILVAAAKGERRAYLVEVFAAGSEADRGLVEAQLLLRHLRLVG